jgi:hypothetical protein
MSGSVGYLPFKGTEISFIAVGMLIISLLVLLKQQSQVCLVKN